MPHDYGPEKLIVPGLLSSHDRAARHPHRPEPSPGMGQGSAHSVRSQRATSANDFAGSIRMGSTTMVRFIMVGISFRHSALRALIGTKTINKPPMSMTKRAAAIIVADLMASLMIRTLHTCKRLQR